MSKEPAHPRMQNEGRQRARAWLVSLALHALLLWLFAALTWVSVGSGGGGQLISLAPGGGGAGGTGGGASPQARSEGPRAPVTAAIPAAPAPTIIETLAEDLLSVVAVDAVAGAPDPIHALLGAIGPPGNGWGEGGGAGTGVGRGTGAGFGDYIGSLQQRGLDVVLVLDATDSMTPYIDEAKLRLQSILDVITGLVPGTRFGVVAYKDYGDDYGRNAVKTLPLRDDTEAVRRFISEIVAGGGGDLPEPIHEALRAATDRRAMAWGSGRKHMIMLVGDSPIHATGREEALRLSRGFAQRGGTINVVDAGTAADGRTRREHIQPDLARIALAGNGSAFLIRNEDAFWRHMILSTFEQRFHQDVDAIIDKYIRDR